MWFGPGRPGSHRAGRPPPIGGPRCSEFFGPAVAVSIWVKVRLRLSDMQRFGKTLLSTSQTVCVQLSAGRKQ